MTSSEEWDQLWSSKSKSKLEPHQAFSDSLHDKSQDRKNISASHSSTKDLEKIRNSSNLSSVLEAKEKSCLQQSSIKTLRNCAEDSDEDIFGCVYTNCFNNQFSTFDQNLFRFYPYLCVL